VVALGLLVFLIPEKVKFKLTPNFCWQLKFGVYRRQTGTNPDRDMRIGTDEPGFSPAIAGPC